MLERHEKVVSKDGEEATIAIGQADDHVKQDGVFGEAVQGAPNYVNVGWIRASVFLMKSQVGLGVLGIPQVFSTIGLIPGIISLLAIGILTSWSSFVVGQFKLRHQDVHSIGDAGYIMGGPVVRELLTAIYYLYMVCISASGMLGVSIALNTVSEHGACTVAFVVVGAVIIFLLSSIQTLDRLSFLGWVGMISIMSAILTLAVAVGLQDRPAVAPPAPEPWDKNFQLFTHCSWADAGSALGTIVFAFGGTPAFFNVVAEMRRPADFPKTVALCQSYVTAVYLAIGIVVYYYCGDYVASPALGSAGPLLKKVCYGLAIPTLIIGPVIYTHLGAKLIFVRMFRGTRHLVSNTRTHWVGWLGAVLCGTVIAFIIGMGVPVFGGLIGLVGALFGTTMSMQTMGCMWLYDNYWGARNADTRATNKSFQYRFLVGFNIFLILAGTFVTILGTYGSISSIISTYSGQDLVAFSCADNS